MERNLIMLQSIYYFITGIWPLIHIKRFMAVTGPKKEMWPVNTVGILVTVSSISLFFASYETYVPDSSIPLAIASTAAFIIMIRFM